MQISTLQNPCATVLVKPFMARSKQFASLAKLR